MTSGRVAWLGPWLLVAALQTEAQDAYVPNQGSDDLTIFDSQDPSDRVTRVLGNQPHEGVASRDARYLFISNREDHTISVFDARTRTEVDVDGDPANGVTRIAVGLRPHGVAVTPDNRYLFVTNDGSSSVSVIEIDTLSVISTVTGVGAAPHMVAIRPDGREAWVGNVLGGDVTLIDVALAVTRPSEALICRVPGGVGAQCRIPAGAGTEGVEFTHDGRTAYVANGGANTVTVVDVASRSVIRTLSVAGGPRRVHVRPDGLRAYVSQLGGDQVVVIDTATHQVVPDELISGVDNGLGIGFQPDGSRIYVPNFRSTTIQSIGLPDTADREAVRVGSNPDSVTVLPEKIFGVGFGSRRTALGWNANFQATRYDVYRGRLADLPDYGGCVVAADDPTDTVLVDDELPPSGEGFFYLVGIRRATGPAGVLGHASDGTLRSVAVACP